ncbi:MAG: glutathione peroxidase [Micrococcaceae bacterium]
MTTFYDFSVKDQDGKKVSLEEYKGKVLLVVNTATKCGFTPQYEGLEELYKEFNDEGFEILDFPCNQFNEQAPGDVSEIDSFCRITYGTEFPRFGKIDVNGKDTAPVYKWLREEKPNDEGDKVAIEEFVYRIGPMNPYVDEPGSIKWNFTKFLIDTEGNVTHRYSSTVTPEDLKEVISKELKAEEKD